MGLWDRLSGKRSASAKTTIFVDGRPARSQVIREPEPKPTKIDWDAFVTETMATEQSRTKSPAPPPVPRKPLLNRLGSFVLRLVVLLIVLPVSILAGLIVCLALFAPRTPAPAMYEVSPAYSPAAIREPERSSGSSSGGDVIHVKGYTRKDGTRVKGYDRRK